MANAAEIKNRIRSIRDTQKITNAMYMISSIKLRKAKRELEMARPYFTAMHTEVKRVFRHIPDRMQSPYLTPVDDAMPKRKHFGCLVITADKGLAGAYNHNILKTTEHFCETHPGTELFIIGECGKRYFAQRTLPVAMTFDYPTDASVSLMDCAYGICYELLERYDRGELDDIHIVYTDNRNGLVMQECADRVLPLHRKQFSGTVDETDDGLEYEFHPSVESVLKRVVRDYLTGFIYGALVDSFCSEQNARMNAMDSAGRNADKMLQALSVQYNSVRQAAITQEITEIAAGAKAQKRKKLKMRQEADAQ